MNCKYCFLKKAFRYGACRDDFDSFKKIQILPPPDENQNDRLHVIDDVECLALSRKRGNEDNDCPSPKQARFIDDSDEESLAHEPGLNSEQSENNSEENTVDDEILFSDEENPEKMIFIDETGCRICNKPEAALRNGVMICRACSTFFNRRCSGERVLRPCELEEVCRVHYQVGKFCQFCRMKKCLESGLSISWKGADENLPEVYSNTEIERILKSAVGLKKGVKLSSIDGEKSSSNGTDSFKQENHSKEPDVELDFSDEEEDAVETEEKITFITDPNPNVCPVCFSVAKQRNGSDFCHGCETFFGRVQSRRYQVSECKYTRSCEIVPKMKNCFYCRLVKCLEAGMVFRESKTDTCRQVSYNAAEIKFILGVVVQDKSNIDLSRLLLAEDGSPTKTASNNHILECTTNPIKNINSAEDCEPVPVFSEVTGSTNDYPVVTSSQEIPSIEPLFRAPPDSPSVKESLPEFEIESTCTITELDFSDEEVVREEEVIGENTASTFSTYGPIGADLRSTIYNQVVLYSPPSRFSDAVDTEIYDVYESSKVDKTDILSEHVSGQIDSQEKPIFQTESLTGCTTVAVIDDQPEETVTYITDSLVCHACSRNYDRTSYCNICPACNTFSTYIRDNKTQLQSCQGDGNCFVHFSEKMCRYCRMKKCLEAGMSVSGFMPFTKTYTRQVYTEDEIRSYLNEKTKDEPLSQSYTKVEIRRRSKSEAIQTSNDSQSKFDDRLCRVCNKAGASRQLGALVCSTCNAFFHTIKSRKLEINECNQSCEIKHNKIHCRSCRFKKCLESGMRIIKGGRTTLGQIYTSEEINYILGVAQTKSDTDLESVLDVVRLDAIDAFCGVCNRPGTMQTVCDACRFFANKCLAANQKLEACEATSPCPIDYKSDINRSRYYCHYCRFKRVLDLSTEQTLSGKDLLSILVDKSITKIGDIQQRSTAETRKPESVTETPVSGSVNSAEVEVLDPEVDFNRKRLATASDLAEKSAVYQVS